MSETPQEFSPNLDVAQEALQPFDVRDRQGMSPMLKLALVGLGLIILALVVMKLYTPGVRDRSDPPRITADNTPFKVKPEEVGGTQTPNQDKVIFEVMDGKSPSTDARTTPAPEQPIKIEAPEPVVPKTPVKQPEPVATQPTQRPSITAPSRPVVTAPASGSSAWVVQVASTRSRVDADNVWSEIQRKFPRLVSNASADIVRADLGDKGIYYRTRVAGLADKSAAQSLCNSFKAAGQACFVTKR